MSSTLGLQQFINNIIYIFLSLEFFPILDKKKEVSAIVSTDGTVVVNLEGGFICPLDSSYFIFDKKVVDFRFILISHCINKH